MSCRQGRNAPRFVEAWIGVVSVAALLCLVPTESKAQSASGGQAVTPLPTVSVDITKPKRRARRAATTRQRAPAPAPGPAPTAPVDTQEARTGAIGVYSNSTSVATKTNTPLINIPQSVDVLTKSFIQDQNFQTLIE